MADKKCPHCNAPMNLGETICSYCGKAIEDCPHCKAPVSSGDDQCSYCGKSLANLWKHLAVVAKREAKQAKSAVKRAKKEEKEEWQEPEAEARALEMKYWSKGFKGWGTKIRNKLLEFSITLVLAAFAGIYGFIWVAIALTITAFYLTVIPKQSPVRGALKFFILLFLALEFYFPPHTQPFIALIILWVGYFTMPTMYEQDDIAKASEAWLRLVVGILLSVALYFALGATSQVIPIALMSAAFFATVPFVKPKDGSTKIYIGKKGAIASVGGHAGDTAIFILLMLGSLSGIFAWGLGETLGLIMGIFWVLSFITGIAAGRAGRPSIGVIMMVVALFVFSFQFTGAVGGELFGAYWPTVEHYGSGIVDPMLDAAESASQGMSDAWLMISCPTCYYQQQQEKERATATKIKSEGTTKSIELEQFKALNYGTGDPTIDPSIPLIGSIVLENEGEFTAKNIVVYLTQVKIKNPENVGANFDGDIDCYEETGNEDKCTYFPLKLDSCLFTSCTGATSTDDGYVDTCEWRDDNNKLSVPGDKKALMFICGEKSETDNIKKWSIPADGLGDEDKEFKYINMCNCIPDTIDEDCTTDSDCPSGYECTILSEITGHGRCKKDATKFVTCDSCNLTTETASYSHADHYVSIGMDYQFEYEVTVQNSVDIMDRDIYMEKFVNDEIKPKSVESKYSGGPVMMSIWMQDQPLRAGETSFATISVYNNGKGMLMNGAIMTIKIPSEFIPEFTENNIVSETRLDVNSVIEKDNLHIIEMFIAALDDEGNAHAEHGLEKGEAAFFTFDFKGIIPEDVIEKTTIITGELDYTYKTSKDLEFPIIKVPIQ